MDAGDNKPLRNLDRQAWARPKEWYVPFVEFHEFPERARADDVAYTASKCARALRRMNACSCKRMHCCRVAAAARTEWRSPICNVLCASICNACFDARTRSLSNIQYVCGIHLPLCLGPSISLFLLSSFLPSSLPSSLPLSLWACPYARARTHTHTHTNAHPLYTGRQSSAARPLSSNPCAGDPIL